jgi:hypothetical protein
MENLKEAARANPLGSALVAGGALWLLLGNRSLKAVATGVSSAAEPVVDGAAQGLQWAGATAREGAQRATSVFAGQAASNVRGGADWAGRSTSGTVHSIGERWQDGKSQAAQSAEAVRATAETGYRQASNVLSDVLESHPLVLGVIGMAVGAVVAGAFGSTAVESEMAGGLSERVKNDLRDRATNLTQTLREGADAVASEAKAAASETVDKLQAAGEDALRAAREKSGVGRENTSQSQVS